MSNPEEKIQEAAENIQDAVSSAKAAVENVKDAIDEQKLSEQRQIRRDKLQTLVEAGRNPYVIETYDVTAHSQDVKDNFDALEDEEVSMAGRIMSKRVMGKASFFHIQDKQGQIQCYVQRDDIGQEEYQWFKKYDIGDIVGIRGIYRILNGRIILYIANHDFKFPGLPVFFCFRGS